MPIPQLVLFDLVGTLLHVEPEETPYWLSIGEALSRAGLCEPKDFNSRYARLRPEWHASEVETSLRARLAEFAVVPSEMCTTFERKFVSDYARRSSAIEGVEPMLAEWSAVSTIGVISNFFIAGAPAQLLRHHNLEQYFAFVIDSAEVGFRKPSSEIFQSAISRIEERALQPHEVLMIGDTWCTDIEGACLMGLRAVYFSPSGSDRNEVRVVQSWDDFRPERSGT